MGNQYLFDSLKKASKNLETVSYEYVKDLITKIRKPIPQAKLLKDTIIDRARKNENNEDFLKLSELSYISDKKIIKENLILFGRANKPHHPVFYGSFQTTNVTEPGITAIAELNEIFHKNISESETLYSISRWTNPKELNVCSLVFSDLAVEQNRDVQLENSKQLILSESLGADKEYALEFLKFISEEFAKPISFNYEYKISAAFAEVIMSRPEIDAIAFPSVQTKYEGMNLVLSTSTVDTKLNLFGLYSKRVIKKDNKIRFLNHKHCLNTNSEIVWNVV